ncbi:hypothetical protein RJT34_05939 [Clitoria ternatea]|uniref:Uncharacterized protein n=1 Tax=Clitoria ternatea TaxID=43366 RepID=A0AAN9K3M3_CLITE
MGVSRVCVCVCGDEKLPSIHTRSSLSFLTSLTCNNQQYNFYAGLGSRRFSRRSTSTSLVSKDILLIPEIGVLYRPNPTPKTNKLPLLLYFHRGAFCICSSSNPSYYNSLSSSTLSIKPSTCFKLFQR